MTPVEIQLNDGHFKIGDIIMSRSKGKSRYCMIFASKKLVTSWSYTVIPLRLSKWKWLRKFQLWVLREILN